MDEFIRGDTASDDEPEGDEHENANGADPHSSTYCIHFHVSSSTVTPCYWESRFQFLSNFVQSRSGHMAPWVVCRMSATQITHPSGRNMWNPQKRLDLIVEQPPNTASRSVFRKQVRPCAEEGKEWTYTHGFRYDCNDVEQIGILAGILTPRHNHETLNHKEVIIKPLVSTDAEVGNTKVVTKHGHKHFKFVHLVTKADVEVEVVDCRHSKCAVTLVIDPIWAKRRNTRNYRFRDVEKNVEVRQSIAFFLVKDHKVV